METDLLRLGLTHLRVKSLFFFSGNSLTITCSGQKSDLFLCILETWLVSHRAFGHSDGELGTIQ